MHRFAVRKPRASHSPAVATRTAPHAVAQQLASRYAFAAFPPDLDAADGCPRCEDWGLVASTERTGFERCPDCQTEAEAMPEVWCRRGKHLRGADRARLAEEMQSLHEAGASIRSIAQRYNRSASLVHSLLREARATRGTGRRSSC